MLWKVTTFFIPISHGQKEKEKKKTSENISYQMHCYKAFYLILYINELIELKLMRILETPILL
jgi:hypothetical protein